MLHEVDEHVLNTSLILSCCLSNPCGEFVVHIETCGHKLVEHRCDRRD
jgi:hypothetical protein